MVVHARPAHLEEVVDRGVGVCDDEDLADGLPPRQPGVAGMAEHVDERHHGAGLARPRGAPATATGSA